MLQSVCRGGTKTSRSRTQESTFIIAVLGLQLLKSFLESIVIGDEARLRQFIPHIGMQREHPISAIAKNFKACRSSGKLWHVYSWMEEPCTLNWYLGTQQRTQRPTPTWCDESVKQFAQRDHDICREIRPFSKVGIIIVVSVLLGTSGQSWPWSLGLALFGPLKKCLDSRCVNSKAAVEISARKCLWRQDPHFYRDGVLKLVWRWKKCVHLLGTMQKNNDIAV